MGLAIFIVNLAYSDAKAEEHRKPTMVHLRCWSGGVIIVDRQVESSDRDQFNVGWLFKDPTTGAKITVRGDCVNEEIKN
jgi:hypothetical protein